MENLPKNLLIEEQFLLDHVQSSQSQSDTHMFDDLSKYLSNMNNNTIDSTNNANNDSNKAITGNSGLQSYHPHQDLAEIGNSTLIHIPFYFENNNVYSRETFLNNYDQQELQNKNMLLQNNSEINFDRTQNTRFSVSTDNSHNQYNQNEWPVTLSSHMPQMPQMPQISSVNEIYPHHNMGLSQMVLESPFPSPDLLTMTTLPVSTPSYSLISFGDPQTFNYQFNPRRSQPFPTLYETEYQSRITSTGTTNTLSQKPPVYTKWTEEEDELLRAAISIYGPHKWSLIAAHVPNRTPMQCSTRWLGALNPTIHKGRWTPEEDAALKEAVSEYVDLLDSDGHPQPIPWNKIASRIPHRTGIQCQARWSEALDPSVRKGKWSPEEDEVLKEGVRRYGRCWIRIAELIDGRTQRQCRTRWVQIKNKQAKIERDAIAAKVTTETTTSDDESNDMLTPPNTAPPTPAQPNAQGQSLHLLRSMNHMTSVPTILPQVTTVKNQSPIMSPTGTSVTDESCVNTPENSSPYFEKSNHNNVYLYTHSY